MADITYVAIATGFVYLAALVTPGCRLREQQVAADFGSGVGCLTFGSVNVGEL